MDDLVRLHARGRVNLEVQPFMQQPSKHNDGKVRTKISFSIAADCHTRKGADGKYTHDSTYINVTCWTDSTCNADAMFVKKGDYIDVEGDFTGRKSDKNGNYYYTCEVDNPYDILVFPAELYKQMREMHRNSAPQNNGYSQNAAPQGNGYPQNAAPQNGFPQSNGYPQNAAPQSGFPQGNGYPQNGMPQGGFPVGQGAFPQGNGYPQGGGFNPNGGGMMGL